MPFPNTQLCHDLWNGQTQHQRWQFENDCLTVSFPQEDSRLANTSTIESAGLGELEPISPLFTFSFDTVNC